MEGSGEEGNPWDKYEKVKVVGQGSFGAAVLVRNTIDGSLYISKEINLQAMNAKDREAAQNEVDVLTRVKHPNIIQYIEHYINGGMLSIIMEYADGGDLLGRIKQQKEDPVGRRFSEDQVMFWFIQMALGVKHMHDNKILHRDIKSANVFLTRDNLVKIGDFGFGKIMANSVAQAKTLCGTPYYFSPELCMGRPYNNKSDIWALGCILAEMCILGHAYEARNIKELMKRVIRGTYQAIPSMYSTELHRLIERMLTKDQAARPNIKSILVMDYVQAKLRQFAKADHEMTAAVAEDPDSLKEVKEMEEFCAKERSKSPHLSIPTGLKGDVTPEAAPGNVVVKPIDVQTDSPRVGPEASRQMASPNRRPSGTLTFKVNRPSNSAQRREAAVSPRVSEYTGNPSMLRLGEIDVDQGDSLDVLVSVATPHTVTSPGAMPRNNPSHTFGVSPSRVDATQRRRSIPKDAGSPQGPRPRAGGLSPRPGAPGGTGPIRLRHDDDPFGTVGHSNWSSVVSADIGKVPKQTPALDKEEFGSFAVRSIATEEAVHRSLMQQVNVTLEARPGSRDRRAHSRVTHSPQVGDAKAIHFGHPAVQHESREEDFSDNAVTMGAHNLRSLLIIELGDDMFQKVYRMARDDDDDEATAVKKIANLIGATQTKEIAPLLFKLVMLEQVAAT